MDAEKVILSCPPVSSGDLYQIECDRVVCSECRTKVFVNWYWIPALAADEVRVLCVRCAQPYSLFYKVRDGVRYGG